VTYDDFIMAIGKVSPSVGTADIEHYSAWEKEFGAS
jgi:SpoVK/Ycf46/Vps4 family AAA+-type ATPase